MSGWIDWSWFGFVWEVWEKGASSICWIFSPLSSIGSNKIDQWIFHFEVTSPPDFRTTRILVAKRTNCFVFIAPKPASNYAIANLNAPKCVRNYKIKNFPNFIFPFTEWNRKWTRVGCQEKMQWVKNEKLACTLRKMRSVTFGSKIEFMQQQRHFLSVRNFALNALNSLKLFSHWIHFFPEIYACMETDAVDAFRILWTWLCELQCTFSLGSLM